MKSLRDLSIFLLVGFACVTPSLAGVETTTNYTPGIYPIADSRGVPVSSFAAMTSTADTVINLTPGGGISTNSQAMECFERAAAQWGIMLKDPVTLNIEIDMVSMGAGILGGARASQWYTNYDTIRNAMTIQDSHSGPEAATLAYLPTAKQFSAMVPVGYSTKGYMSATRANLLALGFSQNALGGYGTSDGSITFSTNFNWDYDNSDGVAPGGFDFESVAVHEIGHILGFVSEIDYADTSLNAGAKKVELLPTPLDLFRFSTENIPENSAEFTSNPRILSPGGDQLFYYGAGAIDVSTGKYNGDGQQASHWKDDLALGIMDPTLSRDEISAISTEDVIAMDLIGWEVISIPDSDPIPEPATLLLVAAGGIVLVCKRQKHPTA